MEILIVGAGVFGVTAALELRQRGHAVRVLDPGPLPHPEASSTDISKIIRFDYGDELHWTELAETCRERWLRWNEELGEEVFHQVGLACLTAKVMAPGSFEYESFRLLTERGWSLERLGADQGERLPRFAPGHYVDGYFNPHAGWAPSRRVLTLLIEQASRAGVDFAAGRTCKAVLERNGQVVGALDAEDREVEAELTLVAAGAWTPRLLPQLSDRLQCVAQPVVHFRVEDPSLYQPPLFPVWTSDIGTTGWYGFPAIGEGILKVGHHGPGRVLAADAPKTLLPEEVERCRDFLRRCIPAVAGAPVHAERLCLYCDSFDHAFFIDHDPERPGLMVAAGGSGHGFKFAPVLGEIIADVAEGKPQPSAQRFAWRERGEAAPESCRQT